MAEESQTREEILASLRRQIAELESDEAVSQGVDPVAEVLAEPVVIPRPIDPVNPTDEVTPELNPEPEIVDWEEMYHQEQRNTAIYQEALEAANGRNRQWQELFGQWIRVNQTLQQKAGEIASGG